ncbi:hypothetical protein QFW77_11260 [Luteimonas sp. RD2P54]|uniref:Sel1 repeat family protein n=1 Tax=Luteimonas endophytica TaxID=3042023 RepID=A0ABT6J9Y8_9GAMM|nr:hypothetical protein [Luteimonas endophytica]MDH5823564.1 hypothetical protein [Luteimonas endophytica]
MMQDRPRRRPAWLLALVVASAGLVVVYSLVDPWRQSPAPREVSSQAVESSELQAIAEPGPATQGSAGAARPRPAPRAFAISQVRLGDTLHEPRTQAEVDWLNRNAFPSRETLVAAGEVEPDPRNLDVSKGISPTQIIHAENIALTQPRFREQAMAYLNLAAVQGSIFALESLGSVYSNSNPVRSEAYFRAAALRGDWKASLRMRARLSPEQDYLSELLSHQIASRINQDRIDRGLPPLSPDVRPGLDDALLEVSEHGVLY